MTQSILKSSIIDDQIQELEWADLDIPEPHQARRAGAAFLQRKRSTGQTLILDVDGGPAVHFDDQVIAVRLDLECIPLAEKQNLIRRIFFPSD